jgi:hypothetical protein
MGTHDIEELNVAVSVYYLDNEFICFCRDIHSA